MDSSAMIQKAYERACTEGLFERNSYQPFQPGTAEKEDYYVHSVVFLAYDGYHLGWYFDTQAQADKAVEELNSLGSVEAVDAYFKKLRDDFRKKKEVLTAYENPAKSKEIG